MVLLAINVVYLIDCSGSMGKKGGVKGLKGSKLEEVALCLKEVLSRPGQVDAGAGTGISASVGFDIGDRVGICAFRQRSLAAPEILDLHHLRSAGGPAVYEAALEKLTYFGAEGGAPINAALQHALGMLEGAPGDNSVVLVTDSSNTVGDDPRLSVYRALLMDVSIRTVALGRGSDRKLLEHLAAKTGGTMSLVEDARELRDALAWNRRHAPLPASLAPAAQSFERLREALGRLESEHARDLVDSLEFTRRKAAIKQSMLDIATQTREAREKADRELSCLRMERGAIMDRLSDLRRRLDSKEIGRKDYLAQSAPLEDRLAALKADAAVRRAVLEQLPSEDYVNML